MKYEALPFRLAPEREEIVSSLLRRVAAHDTLFSSKRCERRCVEAMDSILEMCPACQEKMLLVSAAFSAPDSRVFEVWGDDLVGVIYFNGIRPGVDAVGHYVFWDSEGLSGKTEVINEVVDVMFRELDLQRITVEIPAVFRALINHTHKKLGFGGPFKVTLRSRKGSRSTVVKAEGLKQNAAIWRGEPMNVVVLGRLNPER